MYRGEPAKGLEFFNLLLESDEFNSELGRVTLAAGRLEAELMLLLRRKGIQGNFHKATLGRLIKIGIENGLFDSELSDFLLSTCEQRNYITHNVYALFIDLIDETTLEKNHLLDSDVYLYGERAWQLKHNLIGLAHIIKEK